jgi:long-chain fatty acid transport protein
MRFSRSANGPLVRGAVAAAALAVAVPAHAAFFQIAEQSASGIGNAFAGGAAAAEDAGTVWYNPAGMMRFRTAQTVVGGSYIIPSFKAETVSASTVLGFPIAGGGGEAGQSAFVPNFYYTSPVSGGFNLGVGINAPFGLVTDYDPSWAGRYYALRSDIKVVNYNLAAAFKVNDVVSAGMGVNYQTFDATLSQAVDFATLCTVGGATGSCGAGAGFVQPGTPNDGKATVTASGDAWGYNAGILAQWGGTRVGLAYRSKMKHRLYGDFDIAAPSNVPASLLTSANFRLVDSFARAQVTLPDTLSLSAYQEIDSAWAIMADVTRTGWKDFPELRITFDSGQADSVVTLNLKNSYRYSFGTTYRPSRAWVLRAGVALDQSPVTSAADRTPRLPDSDRRWLTLGAGLQASRKLSFDLGIAYLKLADNSISKTAGAPGSENFARGNLAADYKGSVQIYTLQARWAF